MSWRERLQSIPRQRKIVGVSAILILALVLYVWLRSEKPADTGSRLTEAPAGRTVTKTRDESPIQMGEFSTGLAIEKIRQDIEKRVEEGKRLDGRLQALEKSDKTKAEILQGFAAQLNEIQVGQAALQGRVVEAVRAAGAGGEEAGRRPGARASDIPPIEMIQVPPPREEKPRADGALGLRGAPSSPHYLPAGSVVKVRTLNGVSAYPAAGGAQSAFPVEMVVMDNWVTPNGFSIPMKGCVALGLADGDLSSERVRINARLFSCVFPGGRSLDRPLQGWVAGPDGGLGIAGKVTDRRGRKLGLSFIAGFAAGLSQAFAVQEVTRVISADGTERQIVTGDAITHAGTSALSQAMADIAKFMQQEAARLMPTVDIPGGIDAALMLSEGVDIPEIANLFGGVE
ncbi:MAG: TraB/VirB10 family protein [Nitrospirae bacterium]|nr:TraB/VirB10 family protein [Nitrospirota bacterium]